MTDDLKPLPVKGYTDQSADKVALVNRFKEMEERLLREIDALVPSRDEKPFGAALSKVEGEPIPYKYDLRWLAIARTHIQEGFTALNRSIFQPQRIKLPEDET